MIIISGTILILIGIGLSVIGIYLLNKPFHRIKLQPDHIEFQRTFYNRKIALDSISKVSLHVKEASWEGDKKLKFNHSRDLKLKVNTDEKSLELTILFVSWRSVQHTINYFNYHLGEDHFYDVLEDTKRQNSSSDITPAQLNKIRTRRVWTNPQ